MKSTLRINLTSYRPYIKAMVDRLNEDGVYRMNMTDAVKIAVEQAVDRLFEGKVVVRKTRKKYIKLDL